MKATSAKAISRIREVQHRRRELASTTRSALLAEMALCEEELTASQRLLLSSAVSASVQIDEALRCFTNGHLTPERERALGLARSELRRCLRALGLIERDEEHEEPESITEILAQEGIANGGR